MSRTGLESARVTWLNAQIANAKPVSRRVGILLFDDFSLVGAGIVAELFHSANLATSNGENTPSYDVRFVSIEGGNIAGGCAARVWTDGVDGRHGPNFDLLYIAGGAGAVAAACDERLLAWLRHAQSSTGAIRPIAEGRALLSAAGLIDDHERRKPRPRLATSDAERVIDDASDADDAIKSTLMLIKHDFGFHVARGVAERVVPSLSSKLVPRLEDAGTTTVGEKIRSAARWMEDNCERPLSMADAAQVAAMSERTFLRRFKIEMGVTPSDYLLDVRLKIACHFLVDTELPVDKIARRSGTRNGDRLAKIFRKRMALSPTEYRARSRLGTLDEINGFPGTGVGAT